MSSFVLVCKVSMACATTRSVLAHCVKIASEMHDDTSHRLYSIAAVHTGVQYLYCFPNLGAPAVSSNIVMDPWTNN